MAIEFLNRFPIIPYAISYDLNQDSPKIVQSITDIFFRVGFIGRIRDYASLYRSHVIRDGQTPEILSEQYYGDPNAYWIILWANDIVDPQYDWPLFNDAFTKFIIDKYGSIETAQTTYHHYNRIIERTDNTTLIITQEVDEVDANSEVSNPIFSSAFPDIPYESYDNLADEGAFELIELPLSKHSITIKTYRQAVSYYDWENELNEAKRNIKLIDKQYYQQIMKEFKNITFENNAALRVGSRSARI
jgi:hypothetical protein